MKTVLAVDNSYENLVKVCREALQPKYDLLEAIGSSEALGVG